MSTRFIILMGVAGSGKTTVGRALAARLGWTFYDADDYHPAENIARMASGVPLQDADRLPWITALQALIWALLEEGHPGVLACSALKQAYRRKLLEGNEDAKIVYLKGDYDLIWSRISGRQEHYMKPQMLRSQFDDLEEPDDVLTVDIAGTVEEIVDAILQHLDE